MKKDLYSGILSELIKKVQGVIGKDEDEKTLASKEVEAKETLKDDGEGGGEEKGEMAEDELKEYISMKKKRAPKKATAIFAAIKQASPSPLKSPFRNGPGRPKKG